MLVTTLTKRMAEDLTEYYHDLGVRVRYLHSDIETLERVRILRDLRKGEFDVLVGINLLREGLDLPEVSLVAILDADKEGFLRSAGSLIQTIGRAARHVEGTAILYADKDDRLDEGGHRRDRAAAARIQEAYNQRARHHAREHQEEHRRAAVVACTRPTTWRCPRSRRRPRSATASLDDLDKEIKASRSRCARRPRRWSSRRRPRSATGCKTLRAREFGLK